MSYRETPSVQNMRRGFPVSTLAASVPLDTLNGVSNSSPYEEEAGGPWDPSIQEVDSQRPAQ